MVDILFVNAVASLALNMEANGTMLLATKLLEEDFSVDILRFCQVEGYGEKYSVFAENLVEEILKRKPRSVSFYVLWPHFHIMLRAARELKKRDSSIAVIFGGPHASATAEATMQTMDFVDYLCTGEGEHTIAPFLRAILRNNGEGLESIAGLYYRKDGKVVRNDIQIPLCDLNALPYWDERLYADLYQETEEQLRSLNYFMPIDAGRGCPYSCTFCCTSNFWRRTYRLKSPERIVADIRYYNQKFGIRSFWFSHDAFTSNKKLVSEVCDRILAENLQINWKCTARIDCITEELILKMKQAGMSRIELGVETGSLRMQKLINKNLNLDKAQRMIKFLLENDIRVGLFFMYGFPEETEEDLSQTLELLFRLLDEGVQHVSMSLCRFNPTTAITEKYIDQLVLDPNMQSLTRGLFGFKAEHDIIAENRALFPHLYHFPSALRETYQYLYLLVYIYHKFPNSIKYARALYQGDDLKFYRDFYNNNADCFGKGLYHATCHINEHAGEMIANGIKDFDVPYLAQLQGLLKFEHHVNTVKASDEDITLQETYDFNYIDFMMKRPVTEYSKGRSELLLTKTGGKVDIKLLRIL